MGGFTLHGYPPFYYTTGFRKFLWFAVLVTMFTLIFRLAQLSYDPANVYKQIIQVRGEHGLINIYHGQEVKRLQRVK